jgi:hypothetical protein
MPVLHMDLNLSKQVFDEFVLPLLQTPADEFSAEADPPQSSSTEPPVQFSRVYTGHVDTGASQVITIPLDPGLTVASFALYDTTRSLSVAVTGASGKTIGLSPEINGLVVVDDPSMLLYLGYGFENPKAGLWRVELRSSEQTPAHGADYALAARFVGGADLVASLSSMLPQIGESVNLTASFRPEGEDLRLSGAQASVRAPDGRLELVRLSISGGQAQGELRPDMAGLYGVDITVAGTAVDGTPIERAAFLAFEVQPKVGSAIPSTIWIGAGAGATIILACILLVAARQRRKRLAA